MNTMSGVNPQKTNLVDPGSINGLVQDRALALINLLNNAVGETNGNIGASIFNISDENGEEQELTLSKHQITKTVLDKNWKEAETIYYQAAHLRIDEIREKFNTGYSDLTESLLNTDTINALFAELETKVANSLDSDLKTDGIQIDPSLSFEEILSLKENFIANNLPEIIDDIVTNFVNTAFNDDLKTLTDEIFALIHDNNDEFADTTEKFLYTNKNNETMILNDAGAILNQLLIDKNISQENQDNFITNALRALYNSGDLKLSETVIENIISQKNISEDELSFYKMEDFLEQISFSDLNAISNATELLKSHLEITTPKYIEDTRTLFDILNGKENIDAKDAKERIFASVQSQFTNLAKGVSDVLEKGYDKIGQSDIEINIRKYPLQAAKYLNSLKAGQSSEDRALIDKEIEKLIKLQKKEIENFQNIDQTGFINREIDKLFKANKLRFSEETRGKIIDHLVAKKPEEEQEAYRAELGKSNDKKLIKLISFEELLDFSDLSKIELFKEHLGQTNKTDNGKFKITSKTDVEIEFENIDDLLEAVFEKNNIGGLNKKLAQETIELLDKFPKGDTETLLDNNLAKLFGKEYTETKGIIDELNLDFEQFKKISQNTSTKFENISTSLYALEFMSASKKNSESFTKKRATPREDGSFPEDNSPIAPLLSPSPLAMVIAKIGKTLINKTNELANGASIPTTDWLTEENNLLQNINGSLKLALDTGKLQKTLTMILAKSLETVIGKPFNGLTALEETINAIKAEKKEQEEDRINNKTILDNLENIQRPNQENRVNTAKTNLINSLESLRDNYSEEDSKYQTLDDLIDNIDSHSKQDIKNIIDNLEDLDDAQKEQIDDLLDSLFEHKKDLEDIKTNINSRNQRIQENDRKIRDCNESIKTKTANYKEAFSSAIDSLKDKVVEKDDNGKYKLIGEYDVEDDENPNDFMSIFNEYLASDDLDLDGDGDDDLVYTNNDGINDFASFRNFSKNIEDLSNTIKNTFGSKDQVEGGIDQQGIRRLILLMFVFSILEAGDWDFREQEADTSRYQIF
jgi:formate dehydrogenase maturation protein FdhE